MAEPVIWLVPTRPAVRSALEMPATSAWVEAQAGPVTVVASTSPPLAAWPKMLPPRGPALIELARPVVPTDPSIPSALKMPLAVVKPVVLVAVTFRDWSRAPLVGLRVPITPVPCTLPDLPMAILAPVSADPSTMPRLTISAVAPTVPVTPEATAPPFWVLPLTRELPTTLPVSPMPIFWLA